MTQETMGLDKTKPIRAAKQTPLRGLMRARNRQTFANNSYKTPLKYPFS